MTDQAVQPWSRLSPRVIWVDLVLTVLSLSPTIVALALADDGVADIAWPLVAIAAFGIVSAASDAVRWIFSRYRVTGSHVELRSGVIFRRHRSVRRERIRSVDTEAKLRHRLSGMRMVRIGAGQQSAAGESAFTLDALAADDAVALQAALLSPVTAAAADESDESDEPAEPRRVFATFSPRWVIYNIFNAWAYLIALGIGAAVFGVLSGVGIDVYGWVSGLYDWGSLGWQGTALTALIAVTVFGVLGLAVNYFTEYWGFELARVPGPEGNQLRTRQGLFTTREVNRDENRIRGVQLNEPLFWRWMGVTDTHVITTGLDVNAMTDPAAVLPRTHRSVARRVAADVLGEPESIYDTPLHRHPPAALRRRLWWATLITLAVAAVLGVVVASGAISPAWMLSVAAVWPLALAGAVLAYRALGHAAVGPYLIIRAGLFNRATYVLRRDAVSTVAVKESFFQRRLGLRTVSVMTAAGYGEYAIPDIDVRGSTALAEHSAPGILDEFTEDRHRPPARPSERPRRIPAPDLARGAMLLLIAMAYATVFAGFGFGVVADGQPWWDGAATAVSVLVLDNRAFPMFAILFGYGVAWGVRRRRERHVDTIDTVLQLRRRAWMLIGIGALHTLLVYPGEILTAYGLAILLTRWLLFRSGRTLARAAVITGVFYLVTVTAGMLLEAYARHGNGEQFSAVPGYTTADDWIERIVSVPFTPVYVAVVYPLLVLVILGYMAGKARLLEDPLRHRTLLVRTAVTGIAASILGAVPSMLVMLGMIETGWVADGIMMSLQILTGIAGGAGYVALFALFSEKIVAVWRSGAGAVMATGKRSLTFYLLNSVLVAVILHPDLVGVRTGTLGALGVATAVWLVSLALAVLLERAGRAGPMETLMKKVVR